MQVQEEHTTSQKIAEGGALALEKLGEATLKTLSALLSLALEIGRRALLSWGLFEALRALLPTPWFLGAHAILIVGALMVAGGVAGFCLCLPWAAAQTFIDWASPVARAESALVRAAEWGRWIWGWAIWCAPWALSAWALSAPWQGRWGALFVALAHWLKLG
jgi:hypothetical protein